MLLLGLDLEISIIAHYQLLDSATFVGTALNHRALNSLLQLHRIVNGFEVLDGDLNMEVDVVQEAYLAYVFIHMQKD